MPSLLQLIPRLGVGGAERTTLEISRALVRAGWRSLVASSGGPLQAAIEESGGKHITLPLHSKNPLVVLANVAHLRRCVRAHGVDILHVRSRMPAWSALWAARQAKIPLVATYHSVVHERPAWKRFYNSVMTRGDVVIAKSRYNGERIRAVHGRFPARLEVIVAGVDEEMFAPQRFDADAIRRQRQQWGAKENRLLALLPGRMDANKGHGVFLEALARMPAEKRPVGILLGGSAKPSARRYRDGLSERIRALGLSEDARFADPMTAEAMPLAYAAADIIVAPSLFREPFGRVAVEAQAMERPVIASDSGGFRETIRAQGRDATGWLIPPADADALALALRQAADLDAQQRQEMGRRGRIWVTDNFSTETMCAQTIAVYEKMLKKSCQPPKNGLP